MPPVTAVEAWRLFDEAWGRLRVGRMALGVYLVLRRKSPVVLRGEWPVWTAPADA
jgi:hypothetical protein